MRTNAFRRSIRVVAALLVAAAAATTVGIATGSVTAPAVQLVDFDTSPM